MFLWPQNFDSHYFQIWIFFTFLTKILHLLLPLPFIHHVDSLLFLLNFDPILDGFLQFWKHWEIQDGNFEKQNKMMILTWQDIIGPLCNPPTKQFGTSFKSLCCGLNGFEVTRRGCTLYSAPALPPPLLPRLNRVKIQYNCMFFLSCLGQQPTRKSRKHF